MLSPSSQSLEKWIAQRCSHANLNELRKLCKRREVSLHSALVTDYKFVQESNCNQISAADLHAHNEIVKIWVEDFQSLNKRRAVSELFAEISTKAGQIDTEFCDAYGSFDIPDYLKPGFTLINMCKCHLFMRAHPQNPWYCTARLYKFGGIPLGPFSDGFYIFTT